MLDIDDICIKKAKEISSSLFTYERYIEMFNVGFGDFFIIHEGQNKLAVDCGSIIPSSVPIDYLKDIPEKCMLTHFHKDHYSGYEEMINQGMLNHFTDVYLPNVFSDDSIVSFSLLNLNK